MKQITAQHLCENVPKQLKSQIWINKHKIKGRTLKAPCPAAEHLAVTYAFSLTHQWVNHSCNPPA